MRSYKSQCVFRKKPAVEKVLPFLSNPDFDMAKSMYDFTVRDLDHQPVKLNKYFGNVCIVVNVAARAPGFTYHNFKLLNYLYEKYFEQGLRILAFPCNQFNKHEPGTNEEIKKYVAHVGIKFDVFDQINVNCNDAHPLWKYLKISVNPTSGYRVISDPFTKFIVGKSGTPYKRIEPGASEEELEEVLHTLFQTAGKPRERDYNIDLPPPLETDNRPCMRPWHFKPGHLELI